MSHWQEARHRWAIEIDGRLLGSEKRKSGIERVKPVSTLLFETRKDAKWFVDTYSWDIKPRIVKVRIRYEEE